ncbi:hypothetical protein ABH935_006227 [Catenulispora sp. GAS73]|uniref:hypothetical protein n=1 Tax=Catenulispora sp. GAS73 TaxID=3156269 RepID=UPI003512C75F
MATAPPSPTTEALAGEVRALLRAGLPARAGVCGPNLLELAGVRARALDPADPASRIRALDALLREQMDRLENHELAGPARLLFGAETATSGATLTARRAAAASAAGYEEHHFRKRVEPKLINLLSWQLARDAEDFTSRHAEPPALRPAVAPLALPEDVFAWEAAEHQQAVARLWGAVYLLRAELLGIARLVSMGAGIEETNAASRGALWRHAAVLAAAEDYRRAYGLVLLHADTELGADQIAAFAGWTPTLTPAQRRVLTACFDLAAGLADFLAVLTRADGGPDLMRDWNTSLTGREVRDLSKSKEARSK